MSIQPRLAVMRFAEAMEEKLREKDWRPHWRHEAPSFLFIKLVEELGELAAEAAYGLDGPIAISTAELKVRIAQEAIDVANLAMMLFDHALGCAPLDPREA